MGVIDFFKSESAKEAEAKRRAEKRTPTEFLKEEAGKGKSVAKYRNVETDGRTQKVSSTKLTDVKTRYPVTDERGNVVGYTTTRTPIQFLKEEAESGVKKQTPAEFHKMAVKRKGVRKGTPVRTRLRKPTFTTTTTRGARVTGLYEKKGSIRKFGAVPGLRPGEKARITGKEFEAGKYGGGWGQYGEISEATLSYKQSPKFTIVDIPAQIKYTSQVMRPVTNAVKDVYNWGNAELSKIVFDDFGVLKTAQRALLSKSIEVDKEWQDGFAKEAALTGAGVGVGAIDEITGKPLKVAGLVVAGALTGGIATAPAVGKLALAGGIAYVGTTGYNILRAQDSFSRGELIGKAGVEIGAIALGSKFSGRIVDIKLDKSSVNIKKFQHQMFTSKSGGSAGSLAGIKGTARIGFKKVKFEGIGSYTILPGGKIRSSIRFDFFSKKGILIRTKTVTSFGQIQKSFATGNLGKLDVVSKKGVVMENIVFSTKSLGAEGLSTQWAGKFAKGKTYGVITQKAVYQPVQYADVTNQLAAYTGKGKIFYGKQIRLSPEIKAEIGTFKLDLGKKGVSQSFFVGTARPQVTTVKPITIVPNLNAGVGGAVAGSSVYSLSLSPNVVSPVLSAGFLKDRSGIKGGIQPLTQGGYSSQLSIKTSTATRNSVKSESLTKAASVNISTSLTSAFPTGGVVPLPSTLNMGKVISKSTTIPTTSTYSGSSYKSPFKINTSSGLGGGIGGGIQPPTPPPPPLMLPSFGLGRLRAGRPKARTGGGLKSLTGRYAPSLAGISLGLTTKKTPKIITGIGIRPIRI